MNKKNHIPEPFLFNPIKHHAGYCRYWIHSCRELDDGYMDELQLIGNSTFDYYTGSLSVDRITQEIQDQIHDQNLIQPGAYKTWLRKNGHRYNFLTLSDRSVWTFLPGFIPERYIHFHPARFSPNVIRIRSTTLKTVLLVRVFYQASGPQPDIHLVNRVRTDYLDLSPLRDWRSSSGIARLMTLLE